MKIIMPALAVLLVSSAAVCAQLFNYNYASTAGEGYARGMADAVRSAGMANVENSQAAVGNAQARSLELENRLKYTNTFFENRRQNQMARAAARQPALTSEQLYRIAHQAAPKALTSLDLDPLSGEIIWPPVLNDAVFDSYSTPIQQMFKLRATDPGRFSSAQLRELHDSIRACKNDLDARIDQYRPMEFMQAKRFLESLDYAVDKPAVYSNL